MNKRIKSTLLGTIAAIGLISLLVKGSEKQEPYTMKMGIDTVLIPGAASIFVHCLLSINNYKEYHDSVEYKYFSALNNTSIFDLTGEFEFLTTLGEMRKAFKSEDRVVVTSEDVLKKWNKVSREIQRNNAVVCPNIVPQQYGIKENIQLFFTGKEKEKVPAIVIGTRDCEICKQIEEYYKK